MLLLILSCSNEADETTVWARRASMEIPRSEMPAVVVADEIWVPGGLTDNVLGFSGSDVVEVYDPNSDTWRQGPDLPEARHHAMAAVVGEDLYLIGGMVGDSFEPSALVWRLRADAWEPIAPLPEPRGAGAAVVLDGSIYVIGGVPNGGSVIRYDPETGEWTEVAFARHGPRTHRCSGSGRIDLCGRWQVERADAVHRRGLRPLDSTVEPGTSAG